MIWTPTLYLVFFLLGTLVGLYAPVMGLYLLKVWRSHATWRSALWDVCKKLVICAAGFVALCVVGYLCGNRLLEATTNPSDNVFGFLGLGFLLGLIAGTLAVVRAIWQARRRSTVELQSLESLGKGAQMSSTAPHDRFCDIVMKGGITSGVVYPPAICKLAEQYVFKNIGGTSAGAIAAALTAAAEYRRRTTGSMAGFDVVGGLPVELGKAGAAGNTQLLRLFQPDPPCRRLFSILIGSLNATGTFHRIGSILRGCVTSYWPATLVSIVGSVLIGLYTGSYHAGILILLTSLPVLVGIGIYIDFTRNVVGNRYGLCKGMTTNDKWGPALTPWLHQHIQTAAGLPLDEPLTFGQLWAAPGGPPPADAAARVRSIDLEMFTTNLSHGRPYLFPHIEPTARLFYNPGELAAYLPPEVMQWFDAHARPYAPNPNSPASDPPIAVAAKLNLREIPIADDFPILLAARMSLSFPMLFAAVPLWAIDYEHPRAERTFHRCLFSDGGIASNFPMHLFDGLVPQWPTFGFDLEAKLEGFKEMTFLPQEYMQGISDRWTRFDQAPKAASRMGGFLLSIMSAMQNWNDNTQARLAGVRDRVVRVRLTKEQGGMNLNMPPKVIGEVAERGAEAADKLIARFLGPAPANGWDGWSSQRWIRRDVFIYALNQKIGAMLKALGPSVPHSRAFSALNVQAGLSAPPGHEAPLTPAEVQALDQLSKALEVAASVFGTAAQNYQNDPLPEPELRARSPL
jgi:predicted acylesterase/phospholipase RssA